MASKQGSIGDVRCGLHSGFPKCCIRFFLGAWSQMSEQQHIQYIDAHPNPGYVRCPECVATDTRVKVKPCPVGSHGGNVVARSEASYEIIDGRMVMVKYESFYRDRPGSKLWPIVDGHLVFPDESP